MKKTILLIIAAAMLTGCSRRGSGMMREPDRLEMIRTVGVDLSETGFAVTIASGMGIDGSPPRLRTGEGVTVDDAMDRLQKTSRGQEPFYSHTEHVIIGEELARKGVDEVLDYMARSSEMRIDTAVIMAKGMTANELMTACISEKSDLYGLLRVMGEEAPAMGRGYMFTCLDISIGLRQRGCALILAAETSDDASGGGEKTLKTAGFGVLKGGKLTAAVPEEEAMGVTLLAGKLRNADLALETADGRVGLTAAKPKVRVYPVFTDGSLEGLKIGVDVEVSVTEAAGVRSLSSDRMRREIEKRTAEWILEKAKSAVIAAQTAKIDYIGLEKLAEMRAPEKFAEMGEPFSRLFPALETEISVTAVLRGSYDLEEPLIP